MWGQVCGSTGAWGRQSRAVTPVGLKDEDGES